MSVIKEVSRKLRKNQTPSEKIVWGYLRNRKFHNKKFLRQPPIKLNIDEKAHFFIADFYCAEEKIIVEIDGNIHDNRKEYAQLRDLLISLKEIKVLRFSNNEVDSNIDNVLNTIFKNMSLKQEDK